VKACVFNGVRLYVGDVLPTSEGVEEVWVFVWPVPICPGGPNGKENPSVPWSDSDPEIEES
jgi:hypothetical protein